MGVDVCWIDDPLTGLGSCGVSVYGNVTLLWWLLLLRTCGLVSGCFGCVV